MSLKILIFHIGSVGDTVVTIPALKILKEKYCDGAEFWLLTNESKPGVVSSDSLLLELSLIDKVISYRPFSGLGSMIAIFRFVGLLRTLKFDFVISLLPSERTCLQNFRDFLLFYISGINNIIGFKCLSNKTLYPDKVDGLLPSVHHEALCRINRLNALNVCTSGERIDQKFLFPPRVAIDRSANFLINARLYPERALIAIFPGAKQASNLWPLLYFQNLGERLLSTKKYELIIVGGASENSIAEHLISKWKGGINACGKFSIIESAALLGMADLVVGLDTGTTHLASAQGVSCIALYGGRDHPGRFDPIGSKNVRIIKNRVECEGCKTSGSDPCPIPFHPCMTGISVDTVFFNIVDILDN